MDRQDPQPPTVRPMDQPGRVRPSERLLVEWVAQASVGDPFPEPWCDAHSPLESIVRTLVQLGVIEPPAPDAAPAAVARETSAGARRWLARNPR